MKEKLYIKNFAGIKEAEIELNKINILIGPQATGKSVIAKLAYFCKSYIYNVYLKPDNGFDIKNVVYNLGKEFSKIFSDGSLSAANYNIKYTFDNEYIEIQKSSRSIPKVILSKGLENNTKKFIEIFNVRRESLLSIPRFRNHNLKSILREDYSEPFGNIQIFIPANRLHFIEYLKNYQRMEQAGIFIDPFIKNFALNLEISLQIIEEEYYEDEFGYHKSYETENIDKLIPQIVKGKYNKDGLEEFIIQNDGREVNIRNASSGQQVVIHSLLIMKVLPIKSGVDQGITCYFEEPEAHLFPVSQKHVVELFATTFNLSEDHLQLFITTHSPYILTSFNNLMEAGNVEKKLLAEGDEEKLKQLYDIVPKEQILNPEDVNAFSVTHDEKEPVKSIIDEESKLILADEIDDVSEQTAMQFDKLLDLEYE